MSPSKYSLMTWDELRQELFHRFMSSKCPLCGSDDEEAMRARLHHRAIEPNVTAVCHECAEKISAAFVLRMDEEWEDPRQPPRHKGFRAERIAQRKGRAKI